MDTRANTIAIVKATIEDVPLIVPLFDGYRQFYKQPSDLEGARRFLTTRFEENSSVIFLALRTNEMDKVQACGFMQLYPSIGPVTFESLLLERTQVITSSTVVRRQRVVSAGLFDITIRYSEDHDLWLRISHAG